MLKSVLMGVSWHGEARSRLSRSRVSCVGFGSIAGFPDLEAGWKIRKLALTKTWLFWANYWRSCGWDFWTNCGSEFYYHVRSGQRPFVYSVSHRCHNYSTNIDFMPKICNTFSLKIMYLFSFLRQLVLKYS